MQANGRLYLDFKRNGKGRTYVARQFFQLPLQVLPANVTDDGGAFIYILNPSSGMLEGDLFDISFTLEDKAQAVITTPSSNKIYRSRGEAARQILKATVGEGCSLEYIPEHNVPYGEAIFEQKNLFEVKKGGSLFVWDSVMPGRLARGECFDFTSYISDTQIKYDSRLIFKDSLKIVPEKIRIRDTAVMGEYNIFSTACAVSESVDGYLCDELQTYFEQNRETVTGGASLTDKNLIVIRMLFMTTDEMWDVQSEIWDIVRRHTLGQRAFRIRKY